MSELERTEKEKKLIEVKWFTKDMKKTFDFRKFKTIRSFGDDLRNRFIICIQQTISKAIWQSILKNLNVRQKPQHSSNLQKVKEDVLNSAMTLIKGREMVFKAFESGIFSRLKQSDKSEQSSSNYKYNSSGSDLKRFSKKLRNTSLKLDDDSK